ncbi:MAG: VWA-like domain-containing protein [Vicinamibacterales bacterium]
MIPNERVTAARLALVLDQPFFGTLALSVPMEPSDDVPTMATNGRRIRYNTAFVDRLTEPELIGVLCHEILHCANGHSWRRDERDPLAWNVACDYAINPIIAGAGLALPRGCLLDGRYSGKSAEWIYDRLPKDGAKESQKMAAQMSAAGGQDVEDGDGTPADAKAAIAEWADKLTQAANVAKAYGKLPQSCERFADQAVRPRVDWRALLRRFVQSAAREDYTWRRPSPRYQAMGHYLPSLRSEQMGPIAVVVDTSGSIDGVTLSQFSSEIRAIVEDARPVRTTVLYADAAVQRTDTYEQGEPVELRPMGGGGTDFRPALDAVDAMDEPPVCAVYLTDLDGLHRAHAPMMPLLWVTTNTGMTAPYGDVVPMGA